MITITKKDEVREKSLTYITNDVETIQELINAGLLTIIAQFLSIVSSLALMFILSTYLTLISLAILPVILLIAGVFFFKARRYFILMRRKVAAVTGHLNESISGMRIIKAFAVEDTDYKKFDTLTDAELAVNIKAQKLFAAIPAIVMFVIGFALGSIVLTGALSMQQNQIDAGTLIAFVLYLFNFMGPLSKCDEFIQPNPKLNGGWRTDHKSH